VAFITAQAGDHREAIRLYEESLPLWEALTRDQPEVSDHWYFLAKTHNHLGGLYYYEERRLEDSLRAHLTVLALREELARRHPGEAKFENELAYSCNDLGARYRQAGRAGEALPLLERARDLRERLLLRQPGSEEFRFRLGETWYHLAVAQTRLGRTPEAVASGQRACHLFEELERREKCPPPVTELLARSLYLIGLIRRREGRREEALPALERSCEVAERHGLLHPSSLVSLRLLSAVYLPVVEEHVSAERWAEVVPPARRVIEVGEEIVRRAPDDTLERHRLSASYWDLGRALEHLERREPALSALRQAHEHRRILVERLPQDQDHQRLLKLYSDWLARLQAQPGRRSGERPTSAGR
jgi:tetratricopeptide (TPR) repeat protein